MAKGRNWEFAAKSVWAPLTEAARTKQVTYYEKLAPYMETNSRNVGWGLDPITRFCIDMNLPHLTSIVVNKNTGKPGKGFYGCNPDSISEAQKEVFDFDWGNIANPYDGLRKNESTDSLASLLARNPEKSQEVYCRFRARGSAQLIFRKLILTAYKRKCAICGLDLVEALDAAHIISWLESTPEERISPNNGILLCANHHRLFDSGHIRINSQYEIESVELTRLINCPPAEKKNFGKSNKFSIQLPSKQSLWPDPNLLDRRAKNSSK